MIPLPSGVRVWLALHHAAALSIAGDQRQYRERSATGHGFGMGRHCQRAGFSSDYLGMGVTAAPLPSS